MTQVFTRQQLPAAILNAKHYETLTVASEAVRELAEIASSPNRMNRPDLKFVVHVSEVS